MRTFYQTAYLIEAIAVTSLLTSDSANAFSCGPGHYRGASRCEPCPEGTYISDLNHNSTDCIPCHSAEDFMYEYEAEKCTKTTDTKILCKQTHYRLEYSPEPAFGECKRCSVCGVGKAKRKKVLIQPCGNYTDTVCCESAEFEAYVVFDTLGRMTVSFQCVHPSDSTTATLDYATSAPHKTNTIETVTKSSQETRKRDNLPSAGRKLTSAVSSLVVVTFVWSCIFMFKYRIHHNAMT